MELIQCKTASFIWWQSMTQTLYKYLVVLANNQYFNLSTRAAQQITKADRS